jgi:hypothetical protein
LRRRPRPKPGCGAKERKERKKERKEERKRDSTSVTYSMVQDIFEKLIFTQLFKDILLSLWNPKGHYRVRKSPPLDSILSQPNPVRSIDPYIPKVHLNVILPSTPRSSQWSPPFGPPNQYPVGLQIWRVNANILY